VPTIDEEYSFNFLNPKKKIDNKKIKDLVNTYSEAILHTLDQLNYLMEEIEEWTNKNKD
jgi:hypothetical protein